MDRVGEVLVETYRLERLIAEGGMGDVYEAQHLRLPKRFAVKFLKLTLLDKAEALARFRREAEIVASLNHPNIVNLIDYNVTNDGVPYMVFEFLDGEHLGKRISRGRVPLAEALQVTLAVARALASAHAQQVVHRDLKPENILLCKREVIKVVDFGVAKLRGAAGLTAFNTTVGTVPYMAPEQILGGTVDGRTDQFALGAILYEMLSGVTCFGGAASVPDQALHVLRHQPPPLPDLPAGVQLLLERLLAKDAADRYASIDELLPLLGAAMALPLPELAPLPGEATALTPAPLRPDVRTPTAEVELPAQVRAAASPRSTARSLRAVEPTGRRWLGWAVLLRRPRVLPIVGGVAFGLVLLLVLWLFAK